MADMECSGTLSSYSQVPGLLCIICEKAVDNIYV